MRFFAALLTMALSAGASVTLTVSPTGSTTPAAAYIRADIVNCQNPTILNGSAVVPTSRRFPLNGQASVTFTVEDNVSQIACNGNQLSYYTFTYVANNIQTTLKSVELPAGQFNLANLAPLLVPPFNPGVIQGPEGPVGPTGPQGCVVGNSCESVVDLTPDAAQHLVNSPSTVLTVDNLAAGSSTANTVAAQSVNTILFAEAFSGSDLGAKVAAAFASVAGTAGNPRRSATVMCNSGIHYITSNPVELPGPTVFPYIQSPTVDCQGDLVTKTTGVDGPTVLIHGRDVGDAPESAVLKNMVVENRNTLTNSVAILDQDSMGQVLDHIAIYSNTDAYAVKLGTYDGGPGFREQSRMFNVAFESCGTNAIHVYSADGTPWGYQYDYGDNLRFQMDGGCRNEIFFDGIGNIFNNSYKATTNSSGSASPVYLIRSNSTVASTFLEINGENNDSQWAIGGGAVIDLECRQLARAGTIAYDVRASCHGSLAADPIGRLGMVVKGSEEGPPPARRHELFVGYTGLGDLFNYKMASNIGTEVDNFLNFEVCLTNGTYQQVAVSPTCRSLLYANPMYNGQGGIGIGDKFTLGGVQPETPLHVGYHSNASASGEGITVEDVSGSHMAIIGLRPATGASTFRFGADTTGTFFYNVAHNAFSFRINQSDDSAVLLGAFTAGSIKTTQTPTASTTASGFSVPIVLNGTTYYMRLSATP